MTIDINYLETAAAEYGFSLSPRQLEQFDLYARLLIEWNEKINLTAIVEPKEIVIKHFLDSLLLLDAAEIPVGAALIDVGTGAGFPSLPCGIYRPDLKITLLDSLNKRIAFLDEAVSSLGIPNAVAFHGRAEEQGLQARFREKYDVATARAVAGLRELAEYCLPFVKVGGYFIALKGSEIEEEAAEAENAVSVLGGAKPRIIKKSLPDGGKRSFVIIKKVSQTPTKYPRNQGKIKKQPL